MEQLIIEREGRVLTVRLSNPPRNFMTGRMVRDLADLVEGLDGDRSVGAVVLTGDVEGIFITHFDVQEILTAAEAIGTTPPARVVSGALRVAGALSRAPAGRAALERTPAAGLVELRRIHDLFEAMNRSDKVFVAAVNGLAMGGGCELALACDLRYMTGDADARIGLPEITLGIIPGAGGTQRMTRMLGSARALELMLEGAALTPEEAAAAGLVHRVVPAGELLGEAQTTAARLARRAPATVAALKQAVYEGGARSLPEGLHTERAAFMSVTARPAALRAMRAYVDELARLGEVAPSEVPGLLERYREGTAVDLVAE